MNSDTTKFLVSPVSKGKVSSLQVIRQQNHQVARGRIIFENDRNSYQIISTIPLLATPGAAYNWSHPTLDILFGPNIRRQVDKYLQFGSSAWVKMGQYLAKTRSREEIFNSFMEHGKRRAKSSNPGNKFLFHGISQHHYYNGITRIRKSHIKRRLEKIHASADRWAKEHLAVYTEEIREANADVFVELGTGLGIGTVAVLEQCGSFDKLFAVDIDFRCTKNIDGYARHFNLRDRLEPLAAQFEALPFGDQIIDVILAHHSLDESANITKVLEEVTRVLHKGGKFIGVSRKLPFIQHQALFDPFEFSDVELEQMACAADVYPGFEKLVKMARRSGLKCLSAHKISPKGEHEKVVFVLEKTIAPSRQRTDSKNING